MKTVHLSDEEVSRLRELRLWHFNVGATHLTKKYNARSQGMRELHGKIAALHESHVETLNAFFNAADTAALDAMAAIGVRFVVRDSK